MARVLAVLLILLAGPALAQTQPAGQATLNQAIQSASLTKGSTVFAPTRGIYIGDATACDIAVKFRNDTNAVTLTNVQPGAAYPFQIVNLASSGTTCTTVIALY